MPYALSGYKWGTPVEGTSGGTVLWNAMPSTDINFDSSTYSEQDFSNALVAAFSAWEDVASIDFQYTSDASEADITVEMGSLAGSTVGEATTTYSVLPGIDQIIESEIVLDSDETWSPYGESDLNFYAVAVHEIGHAIGLNHVNDPTEIMNPVVSADDLGDGDIEGAQTLYGTDEPQPVDDGGSGGGGAAGLLALLFGGILAALGGMLGGAGAVVAMAVGLGSKSETPPPSSGEGSKAEPDPVPSEDAQKVADALQMADEQGIALADLIPVLESQGVEIETDTHSLSLDGTCDGCCGGHCGDPVHMEQALEWV